MTWYGLFFSCEGRIGRATYFWMTSAILLCHVIVAFSLFRADITLQQLEAPKPLGVLVLYILFFGWMNWALATKRFHDFGRSGWATAFLFFGSAIPVFWIYILFLLGQLFFRAGDFGANAYGPPPGRLSAYESYGEFEDEARHAKAFAAIDALARGEPADARPARRILPGAAPEAGPARAAGPASGAAGFGRRQSAPT